MELRLSGRFFPKILSSAQLVTRLASLTVVSGVAFVIAYRLAVMQHRVSGEFYKALFDIHRHELAVVPDSAEHRQNWQTASIWLRYMRAVRRRFCVGVGLTDEMNSHGTFTRPR